MKLALTVVTIALLATCAGASTVDFAGFTPTNVQLASASSGGLDFTSGDGIMYVWCCNSPNSNGTEGLIYAFGSVGNDVTVSLTGGGTFSLNSVDMSISWYDPNTSETIWVNGNPLTLTTTLTTYNLNLSNVSSVTFSELPSGTGYWFMDNVTYNTVPEPGTLAMLGSGLVAGLGVMRRKMML